MLSESQNLLECYFGVKIRISYELEFYLPDSKSNAQYVDFISEGIGLHIVKENDTNQYEIIGNIHEKCIDCVKEIEKVKHALGICDANFCAKPFLNRPGNGLHFNVSIESNDVIMTYLYAVGGLCHTMMDYMCYFAPTSSSYIRYKHWDINTPTTVSWGNTNNRTVSIRFVKADARIEHRVPSPEAITYFSIYGIVNGIFVGIQNKILPPNPVYGNAFDEKYDLIKIPDSIDKCIDMYKL